ncbi:MAG TPA: MFS transporter [Polyangiales bacterium]|nr:MFS transporter [Polyangiales bacterium]
MNRASAAVLGVCSIAVFLASLDATVLYVAFQDIRRSYPDVSPADLSWVLNGYTIAYAALLVPAGRLSDRYGRKRFFLAGVALFSLASLACGLAPNALTLIAARVIQAAGAAALLPASLALVLDAFPPERRASAVGIWGAVGGLAAAVGPSLGAVVVEKLGWEWVFFINLPFGAFAFYRGRSLLTESRTGTSTGVPDPIGILLLSSSMALLACAVVKGGDWGYAAPRTWTAALIGVVAMLGFVLRSRTAKDPAVDLRLFADTKFLYANAATFVFAIAFVVMFFGNVFFLTRQWHYSLQLAGLAITPGPMTVVPFAMLAGRIADKRGYRAVLMTGSALFAIAGVWFVVSVDHAPNFLGEWLPRSLLTGAAVGLVLPSLSGAAVASLPRADYALGSAISQATRQFGSVLGVAVAIAILGETAAGEQSRAFVHSYSILIVGGILTGLLCAPLSSIKRVSPAVAPAAVPAVEAVDASAR